MSDYLMYQIGELQAKVVQAYSQNPDGKLSLKHAVDMLDIMRRLNSKLIHIKGEI